jgi:hypothetical protein
MKTGIIYAVCFTIFLGAKCAYKPVRPDVPVCLHNSNGWVCTDSRGDFSQTESELICTTFVGYSESMRYLDKLEKRIKELERLCR